MLVDDTHPLNMVESLRNPETRAATIATLAEISGSHLLDEHSFTEFFELHPGQGPLFEPVTRDENYTEAGSKRVADYIDQIKPADPVRDLGADQSRRLLAHVKAVDENRPVPELSPEDSARLATVQEYATRLKAEVLPAALRELQDIVDLLPPGADVRINARAKDPQGLLDKVGRMAAGWQGRDSRPDYQIGDVIDAVGARITLGSAADLGRVLAMVKERFGTGDGGRVLEIENMYAQPKRNNPAYRVVPLVVSMEIDHVPYTYELQLTTRRASVAADMEHNSVYKDDYIPATAAQKEAVKRAMRETAAIEQLEASADDNA
jgi:ppGpp synthetase/RelA/SpoT-type nucleotidyltranferase